jgi:hypothetical protein
MFPKAVPSRIVRNPLRADELKVYRALESQLDDQFSVFYTRPWLGLTEYGEEIDGEADFVVAHPVRGILAIEVKGGAVARDRDTDEWTSTDSYRITHAIKNPVEQARTSKHQLLKRLREDRSWGRRFVRARHGVVLPDCVNPGYDLGFDMPLRIFAFSEDMPRLGQWVLARLEAPDSEHDGSDPVGADGMQVLERLLAASFHLRFSLASGIRDDEEDIRLLTEQQSRVLRILSTRKRIAMCGGAGTGKTAMALQKALELSDAGQHVLLTCFNRPLAARLRTQAGGSAAVIESFHGLCARAMSTMGQSYEAAEAEYRRMGKAGFFDQEALPGALLAAAAEHPEFQFDAVIVDEGQDFHASWWAALDTCAKSSKDLILCAFFDNNQSVYPDRATSAIRFLEVLDFPLSENLRNTRRIFACAKGLYRGDAYTSAGPEGREVAWLTVDSAADTRRRIGETVGQLCKVEHVAAEDIAILTCRGVDAHSLAGVAHIAGVPVTRAEAPRKGHLIVDSVRRFKGLESPIVLLVDIEAGVDDEVLYVGLTRARSHLICFGVDPMRRKLCAMGAPFR